MLEYLSEAVVLSREPSGDLDSRFSVFTKRFGKLVGKAKSARKITSKLAGHLEPGNLVFLRIVEKSGLQIVDALKQERAALSHYDLHCLDRLLGEGEPDPALWQLISRDFGWRKALSLLGWDAREARCETCGKRDPLWFDLGGQRFFCEACASKAKKGEVLYIG